LVKYTNKKAQKVSVMGVLESERSNPRSFLQSVFRSRPDIPQSLRANLKVTQGKIADRIGVHLNSVRLWETGRYVPTLDNAFSYFEALEHFATSRGYPQSEVLRELESLFPTPKSGSLILRAFQTSIPNLLEIVDDLLGGDFTSLAKYIGVSESDIIEWHSGKSLPTQFQAAKYEQLLEFMARGQGATNFHEQMAQIFPSPNSPSSTPTGELA
jgi:DNA-binding XRE family transcriptional regulator